MWRKLRRASAREISAIESYGFLAIVAASGFVTSFGAHVVATNLPTLAEQAAIGAIMIGLLIGVYDFAELFVKPFAGLVADRQGMKVTLLAGLAIFIAGSLLYLAVGPGLLILVRFIQGFGAAALSTASITLVVRFFPTGRGKALGIYNAIKGAGYVLAPPAGGFLAHRYGFASIFITSAAVGGLAFLAALVLPDDRRRQRGLEDDDDDLSLRDFFRIFKDPRLLPIYGVIVVNMFMVGILFGFLPVYLHHIGYDAFTSGLTVSAATLAYLAVQPFAGHLGDRVDLRVTLVVGLSLAALAIITVTFTTGVVLILVVVVAGLGIGTVWTNSDALVSATAEPRQLGASIGAAQSFKELGDMVGPVLIGVLTQLFGVRVGFVACGLGALVALGVLVITQRGQPLHRTRRRPQGPHDGGGV
jgi:MFS family permease